MADTTALDAVAISKSDSTVVDINGFYVGTAGDVAVVTFRGTTVTFPNVPAGAVIPIRCVKVLETGTEASDIVGLKF